jgi:hypothetical protein
VVFTLLDLFLLLPATITTEGCTKLANGYNFRDVQDVAARFWVIES